MNSFLPEFEPIDKRKDNKNNQFTCVVIIILILRILILSLWHVQDYKVIVLCHNQLKKYCHY